VVAWASQKLQNFEKYVKEDEHEFSYLYSQNPRGFFFPNEERNRLKKLDILKQNYG
jgi:hypothetical protein